MFCAPPISGRCEYSPAPDVDPYHKPKKRYVKPLVCSALAIALVGGGAYFVIEDPLGVMPGFYQAFEARAIMYLAVSFRKAPRPRLHKPGVDAARGDDG